MTARRTRRALAFLFCASWAFASASAQTPPAPATPALARWLDVQALAITSRYRLIETTAGEVVSSAMQLQPNIRVRLKADRAGRLSLHIGTFGGNTFASSWMNTGIGPAPWDGHLWVKQFYVALQPARGIEVQGGSLYFLRGEHTEITSYDNDGYLTGARVLVRQPGALWVDEVALTRAWLGDFTNPNAFPRLARIGEGNYQQALVSKRLGHDVALSADFTRDRATDTWREAIAFQPRKGRIITQARVELYQRVAPTSATGFGLVGERRVTSKMTLGLGWASIDRAFGGLNGDRYNRGRRWFAQGSYQLPADLSFSWFYTQAVRTPYAVSNAHRTDVLLSWNALGLLRRHHVF